MWNVLYFKGKGIKNGLHVQKKVILKNLDNFVRTATMKRKKNNINKILTYIQEPKHDNDNTNNNNRTLLVWPSFSGKTFLKLKVF